jgi:hypothetical protein
MEITKEFLKEKDICGEVFEWFCNQNETDLTKIVNKLLEKDRFDEANRLIIKLLNKDKQKKYAIHAAESVLFIFEDEYPDDKRLRNAINIAKEHLKNKSAAATDDAAAAAYAAAATDDAAAAAYAYADNILKQKIIEYGVRLINEN